MLTILPHKLNMLLSIYSHPYRRQIISIYTGTKSWIISEQTLLSSITSCSMNLIRADIFRVSMICFNWRKYWSTRGWNTQNKQTSVQLRKLEKKNGQKIHPSSSTPTIGSFTQLLSQTRYTMVHVQILLCLLTIHPVFQIWPQNEKLFKC